MSLWKKITGEFIDVIEWKDDSSDTLVHQFERYADEIKYGAQLTVREGQMAVFVNEGQLADVFEPGMYELHTANLPVMSTLKGWKYGFESPFKAEVYFINTRPFHDLKWGTKNPVMLRDPEFGPVRLRAFGTYVIRVDDPALFLTEVIATRSRLSTRDIAAQLRNIMVSRFTDIIGESKIPVLDLAGNYDELGQFLTQKIQAEFADQGLFLMNVLVENISLPPKVEEALDKRTSMGVIGNLKDYMQYQAAEAMTAGGEAGSAMSAGAGIGMGAAMAQQMMESMNGGNSSSNSNAGRAAAPPPLPTQKEYFVAVNGQQAGPYPMSTLQGMARQGQLATDTLVWSAGMAGWTAAGSVAELAALFAQVPPPLPQ